MSDEEEIKDLEGVKEKLYKAFNKVSPLCDKYETEYAIEKGYILSLGTLGQAIVEAEEAITRREYMQKNIDKAKKMLDPSTKRDIHCQKPLNFGDKRSIKLRKNKNE